MKYMRTQVSTLIVAWVLGAGPAAAIDPAVAQHENALEAVVERLDDVKFLTDGRVLALFDRVPITEEVALYSAVLPVGDGPYDRIGVHRVVREATPGRPIRAPRAVFFVHGDRYDFGDQFMTNLLAPELPRNHALPVYLAENGVDVWGIDQRWTAVPAEAGNLDFMADWGLETMARDVGTALAFARLVRRSDGSGLGRLHLLGYSRGGQVSYTYVDAETQMREDLRHVGGLVLIDSIWRVEEEGKRQAECDNAVIFQDDLDAGAWALDFRFLSTIGVLAEDEPDAPSPFVPGLTNFEVSVVFATTADPFGFHFLGGVFDATGFPVALRFTGDLIALKAAQAVVPFTPTRLRLDAANAICGDVDVPFDDHFPEVEVPVLYLGAGGGFRELGIFGTSLLGSTDVTAEVVRLLAPEERDFDLGHSDVILADDAPDLFWLPILSWIEAH